MSNLCGPSFMKLYSCSHYIPSKENNSKPLLFYDLTPFVALDSISGFELNVSSWNENELANLEKSAAFFSFETCRSFLERSLIETLSRTQIHIWPKTMLFKNYLQLNCHLLDLNLFYRKPSIKACFKKSGKFETEERCWLFQISQLIFTWMSLSKLK